MGGAGAAGCCNEPVPSRAQILSRNVERMGVRHAVVVSALPGCACAAFPRRSLTAFWSTRPARARACSAASRKRVTNGTPIRPARCADRQMEIFGASREDAPSRRHDGLFHLHVQRHGERGRAETLSGAAPGIFASSRLPCPVCPEAKDGYLHLYPHEMRGEGHFVSRLKKSADEPAPQTERRASAAPSGTRPPTPPPKAKRSAPHRPAGCIFRCDCAPERLYIGGRRALDAAGGDFHRSGCSGLRVLRTGLLLAHAEGKRSEPDHALAMALRPEEAARTASLTQEQALAYQAGETLCARRPARRIHPALLRGRFARLGQTGGRHDEKPLSQGAAAKVKAGFTSAEVCKKYGRAMRALDGYGAPYTRRKLTR